MYWLTLKDELAVNKQLRNNEYYRKQEEFDYLYKKSARGDNFYDLTDRITETNNLRLAYRNLKGNKGSNTPGLSGKSLIQIANMKLAYYLLILKTKFAKYQPSKIKRVGIPKSNGKIRYLGIKEPDDKIMEQAIYQVLDPITSAKFHNNSNGFIKGRSCHRVIAQMLNYIINEKLYFVVDIDIKGFFDNVNHGKLLKQLWTLGIRDKRLISIISTMLKAEIFGVGIPEKGTPQGGVLSPLLANIYLNELDWWLDSKKDKGIRFVRYADDFKILCPNYATAKYMLETTTEWLNKRLKLEVSEEKTKIVNLKRNYSVFLGLKIKIKEKNGKYHIVSHMTDKAITNCKEKVKKQIKIVKLNKNNPNNCKKEIEKYNAIVQGIHNYYDKATMISLDLKQIGWIISSYLGWNFKDCLEYKVINGSDFVIKKYGTDKKLPLIRGQPIIPIERIEYDYRTRHNYNFNFYKETSRENFHKQLGIYNEFVIDQILAVPILEESVELNDNVIPRFCGQLGKSYITGNEFWTANSIYVIRKHDCKFSNKYDNIILVESKVFNLIKLKNVEDVVEIERMITGITSKQLEKINNIRKENNLPSIAY